MKLLRQNVFVNSRTVTESVCRPKNSDRELVKLLKQNVFIVNSRTVTESD